MSVTRAPPTSPSRLIFPLESRGSSGIAFERRVMLEKPFIALEHVVPIEDRQAGGLDPPADPAFLRRIERQRRRDFAAIDEFGQDGLAIGSSERARGISVISRLHWRACDHAQEVPHNDRRLLSYG